MTDAAKVEAVTDAIFDLVFDMSDGQCGRNEIKHIARAAIAALEAIDGWRGIESAPRDGMAIMAWAPDSSLSEPFIVQWCDGAPEIPDDDGDWYPQGGEGMPIDVEITRWRPLPEPPAP